MRPPSKPRTTWTGAVGAGMGAFRDFLVHHLGEHISPNSLTLVGTFLALGAGIAFANGHFRLGAVVLLCSSLFDVLDGAVARANNHVTRFGGFWDSTLDRIADFFVFGGLLWFYAYVHDFRYFILTLWALGSAILVSYTRARAECIIESCHVGFCERPERLGILMVGGVLGLRGMQMALWILVVLGTLTWVHRTWYTYLSLEGAAIAKKPVYGSMRTILSVVLWDHRRASLAYDIKIALLALLVLGYVLASAVFREAEPSTDGRYRFSLETEAFQEPEDLGQGQFYASLEGNPMEDSNTAGKNAMIQLFHEINPELVFDRWEEDADLGIIKGFYYRTKPKPGP